MRRVVLVIAMLVVVSGGVYLALGPAGGDPPSAPPPPASGEPLGLCSGGEPVCNETQCTGSNCHETCDAGDPGQDTGWRSCCRNGTVLNCAPSTVKKYTCPCEVGGGGGFCAQGSQVQYSCN